MSSQVVIFGASGDLTARKLIPALSSLFAKHQAASDFSVVGCARRPKTDESWRAELREVMPVELCGAFDEPCNEFLVNAFVDTDTAGRCAALARSAEPAPDGAVHRQVEIRVVHHENNIFASHFEAVVFEGRRASLRDDPASRS